MGAWTSITSCANVVPAGSGSRLCWTGSTPAAWRFCAREADEFFSLYRLTSSDLNLVQTRTASPSLLEYLEDLIARAYSQLQSPRKAGFFRAWWMILRYYFPAALRSEWRPLTVSAATVVFGILVGLGATMARPSSAQVFLPPEHLDESPRDRVGRLEEAERGGNHRINSADEHAALTVFLFNNNIRVSVLAFALGVTFGVGTIIMLFYNGAMVGSLAALLFRRRSREVFYRVGRPARID